MADELTGGALAGERYRVIVSTDLGGSDPDDIQSMVHYLVYADVFDTEGLISSPPGRGRAADVLKVIDAYEADYPALRASSPRYPEPEKLRGLVRQGATDRAPEAGHSEPTEGSRWIIERARAEDERPLWVLVWGSITDVAQAVHDEPSIKKKIRIYYISSWNTQQDPQARNYLFNHHPDLWWIEADTTFRGMYMGGRQDGDLDNRRFVERHVRGHGALGRYFWDAKRDIKMGDTPSVLYLLRGDPLDPAGASWGGRFHQPHADRPNYWYDDPDPSFREGDRRDPYGRSLNGAVHVSRWREAYLRDWQARMERLSGN